MHLTDFVFIIFFSADEQREAFIRYHCGLPHLIKRNNIFEDVIRLYQDKGELIVKEYPFHIRFVGEMGVDIGGVA